MKNKSEKLARNAIRARKAKNKRANEQDKPKNGKRWLIRLGALMGCLLLVSALVVPCFADPIYYPEYTVTDDFYEAFLTYNVDELVKENAVFMRTFNAYRNGIATTDPKGLFSCENFYYGNTSFDSTGGVRGIDANLFDGSAIHGEVYVGYITIDIIPRDDTISHYLAAFDNGKFDIDIFSNGDDVQLIVLFTASFDTTDFKFKFTSTDGTYKESTDVEFEHERYMYEIYEGDFLVQSGYLSRINTAYTVPGSFLGDLWTEGALLLKNVLLGGSLTLDGHYHPLAFANSYFAGQLNTGTYADGYNNGYSSGYNTGRNEGYTLGYNEGHDVGYEKGEEEGYNIGYEAGVDVGLEEGYDLGYMEGYDVGYDVGYGTVVDSSASANLGKNLLGDTLSAPFAVLKSIPIVEWETATGTVSITVYSLLMALIGFTLVVWFLKMFAGG